MVSKSITVKNLNPALGAEVKGVDFRLPLTPDVVSQIPVSYTHLTLPTKA